MKEIVLPNKFNKFSIEEKKKIVLNLLKDNELSDIVDSLIKNKVSVLEVFLIMDSLLHTKNFKKKYNYSKLELRSYLVNKFVNKNKSEEIKNYFDSLSIKDKKELLKYETEHETNFSKMKLCKNLYRKYFNISKKKVIDSDIDVKTKEEKEIIQKKRESILKRKIEGKKTKIGIASIILIVVFIFCYSMLGYLYYIVHFYNNHVYPNVYLNDNLISEWSHSEVLKYFEEKDNELKQNINFQNTNDIYTYTYEEIGLSMNKDDLINKILYEKKNMNGFEKLYQIFHKEEKRYKLEYKIDDTKYNAFLESLRDKVNVPKKNEYLKISGGNINYQKGINGFTLIEDTIREKILNSLGNDSKTIILEGTEEKVSNSLGSINKKMATFTTEYNESQGRATNIRNAARKLNGKIVYSGDVFSFYRTVGPYNGSNGYIFYGKDVGSGVCQVSTTVYNSALLLNLPIVSRYNHGDMVYYVDYGMDATVYGSSVDFKFKNNTNYPIYIEASASGGHLTVSFWTNENAIPAGYSYKPRVEKVSYLGYKTYLDTYYNGNYVSTKYLNSSYYTKGK